MTNNKLTFIIKLVGFIIAGLMLLTTINAYLSYESKKLPGALGGAVYQAKHALLPLPQGQIDLLNQTEKILTQNPGY